VPRLAFALLCIAALLTAACSPWHRTAPDEDRRADATPAASCPARPSSVEGQACSDTEPSCGLCDPHVTCCRQILVCSGGRWMHLEAGPCEP
jgi:hypothetical protein